MKKIICILFLLAREGYGAADFEVERVSSPYVESRDVGTMMQENSQHMLRKSSLPLRSYSTIDRSGMGCATCQYGMDGASSGSSYGSSSYSYGGGMGTNPVYSHSPQSSSSMHDLRKEKEFINGQQIYDLHHEKKYQDGRLIDEVRQEKSPDDFGVSSQPAGPVTSWSSWSSWSSWPNSKTYNSGSNINTDENAYNANPQTSRQRNRYEESRHAGYGVNNDYDDHFDDDFEKEVERMREELRRKTVASSHPSYTSVPRTSGESRRAEHRKETKYVNGKPVYMLNEERKYKDGKLIHDVRDEKGPDDLGTSNLLSSSPGLTYPTGETYSHQHEELYKNQMQHPTVRYPSYKPAYASSASSESASSYSTSNQQPHYRPSSVYSSETIEERRETQQQSHGNNPVYHYNENEDIDEYYRQSQNRPSYRPSYYRPEVTTPTTTTTTSTTPRPYFYNTSPAYTRVGYNPQPAGSQSYEEQSSSTYYSHNRPVVTPERYDYRPERPSPNRPYDRPDTEEKIREASQSSYYDLSEHKSRPDSISQQEQFPSYKTGTFNTYSENREIQTEHQTQSQPNRVTEVPIGYQHGSHISSASQEEQSRVSSRYYPASHPVQRPINYDREKDNSNGNSPVISSPSDYGVPGFISGPESTHDATSDEEEEERYDISPFADASDRNKGDDEIETNNVQFENNPSSRPHYGSPRLPEPDRLVGSNERKYSVFNSSRTDHITKVLPSRWVETKTIWKYLNGKLVSETQHHRYYENGILIHENSTKRTRDEMKADGIDVLRLDLSTSQLSEYGPAVASTSHSQKHEMHEIKRFRNGQQVYELSHERRYQDGNLVHDNRVEKDEDDFELPNYSTDHQYNQAQNFDTHSLTNERGLYSTGGLQTVNVNPKTYSRKHELRQEEEFLNGQKVYDLHHEREYQDGRLVRENKTELGPEKLGTQPVVHRDALKDLLSGHNKGSVAHSSLLEQQRTADSILKTSCVTCGAVHGTSAHSQGSILGTLSIPATRGSAAGSSYRHDMNVEEHYENGQLVKGREAKKKWIDGQLVDAKEEHYYDGPSRANVTVDMAPGFSSSASMSAFSSAPAASVGQISQDTCTYNPCRNKGTCKESVRGPICICVFGFKGTYCEEAYCPSRYCRYGGSCIVEDGHHVCSCREGYSGYRCSITHQKIRVGVSG